MTKQNITEDFMSFFIANLIIHIEEGTGGTTFSGLIRKKFSTSIDSLMTGLLSELPEEQQPTEGYFDDVDNVRFNQGLNVGLSQVKELIKSKSSSIN